MSNQGTALRNDRDAIIAIVAEHIVFDDEYLRRATIKAADDPERDPGLTPIKHGAWLFAYDSLRNVIYYARSR